MHISVPEYTLWPLISSNHLFGSIENFNIHYLYVVGTDIISQLPSELTLSMYILNSHWAGMNLCVLSIRYFASRSDGTDRYQVIFE